MDWTLEVVVLPVSDVDRAKAFYSDQLGWNVDVDRRMSEQMRVVQVTPPGSGCSVTFGDGLSQVAPGTYQGLQLCVSDIDAARAQLVASGVEVDGVSTSARTAARTATEGRGTPSSPSPTRTATAGWCRNARRAFLQGRGELRDKPPKALRSRSDRAIRLGWVARAHAAEPQIGRASRP